MESVYRIIEVLLPFQWIAYDFMKNAFLCILIIAPLFAFLGTMIVNNRLAFFSDALGHSAFTGIAVGILLGLTDTNLSMICFAVIFALLLNQIKWKDTVSTDTIISVFSSLSTAIGLVVLSQDGKFSKYSNLLIGDILSIQPKEILLLLIVLILTMLFWGLFFNKLNAFSLNATLARSKQINTKLLDNLFVVLIAIVVMLSIKWVGILIINALLILPAAASRNLATNMREYHLFSLMISVFSCILGLILSYYGNAASGPTIVIIAAIIFFATLLLRPILRK